MNYTDCNILLVDDEKEILEMNKSYLVSKGFQHVDIAMNGQSANDMIREKEYHIAILDIMMPDIDGLSLYEAWCARRINIPVIFLSAKDEEASRLKGLGLGADDYITKPYSMEELYLRIKVVLRRTYHLVENQVVNLGNVKVDLSSGKVYRGDEECELTAKEFMILSKLHDNQGKIVSINSLMDTLWPDGSYGLENSLIVHIRRLREKIEEDPSSPKFLQTVRGLGYRLMGDNK